MQINKKPINWNVDEDNLFNEFNHVVNVMNTNLKEWNNNIVSALIVWYF